MVAVWCAAWLMGTEAAMRREGVRMSPAQRAVFYPFIAALAWFGYWTGRAQ